MLMDVYTTKELDKIDDQIEKIADGNKIMKTLHVEIHRLNDQAQEKVLEAKKHYSDACLDIFEDDAWERLIPIEVVVEEFWKSFEQVSNDEDIRHAFKMEGGLLELDVKLKDFVETHIEVDNYR